MSYYQVITHKETDWVKRRKLQGLFYLHRVLLGVNFSDPCPVEPLILRGLAADHLPLGSQDLVCVLVLVALRGVVGLTENIN